MSLKLLNEIPFLDTLPNSSFRLLLNNVYITKKGDIQSGLAKIHSYDEKNGETKLLVSLYYNLAYGPLDFLSTLLRIITPILPYIVILKLSFTYEGNVCLTEPNPTIIEEF
jgi:hypothetical protein